MRSVLYLALAAVENAFQVPPGGYDFTAGKPTTLTWAPSTEGTVTIKLQMTRDITPGSGIVLGSNLPNSGSFSFTPSAGLVEGKDYTIEIIDDQDPSNYNFTPTFTVDGATGTPSGTPTATHSSSSSEASTTEEPTSASSTTRSSSSRSMTTITTSESMSITSSASMTTET
ncbi:hypothetical protein FQN49_004211, partial [Arthroderma sp. PD_2]